MSESSEALIIQAISEAKSGNKQAARKILSEVVVQEPNNADAWYLFSQVVEKPDEAIYCLDQVLSINPQDAKALKRIHQLKSSFTTSKSNGRMSKGIGLFPLSIITLLTGITIGIICILSWQLLSSKSLSNSLLTEPPSSITNSFPPKIPGITFQSLSSFLGREGVTCGPMQRDAIAYSSICDRKSSDGSFEVSIEVHSGARPDDIYLILASVMQYGDYTSDAIASEFLGYVAELPYQTSEPEKAKAWVTENIPILTSNSNYEPETMFGGVRYHIPCKGASIRCLAIGHQRNP